MSLEQIFAQLKATDEEMQQITSEIILAHKTDTEEGLEEWLAACEYKLRDPDFWF
jgi:hypothetical protein